MAKPHREFMTLRHAAKVFLAQHGQGYEEGDGAEAEADEAHRDPPPYRVERERPLLLLPPNEVDGGQSHVRSRKRTICDMRGGDGDNGGSLMSRTAGLRTSIWIGMALAPAWYSLHGGSTRERNWATFSSAPSTASILPTLMKAIPPSWDVPERARANVLLRGHEKGRIQTKAAAFCVFKRS